MTVTWRKLYPNDTSRLSDLPTLHSDNFNVVQSAGAYEHYSVDSATLSGYHKPGIAGFVYEGTTAGITGLSSPADGAMAYDTSLGVFKYYTISNSAWNVLSTSKWSRVRAYRSTNVNVTAGASADILIFDTEDYDTMLEYNNTTGVFTCLASGTYLINANVSFTASGATTEYPIIKLYVYVDSALSEATKMAISENLSAASHQGAAITTVKYLTAGQTVDIRYQKTQTNDTILSGSSETNLSIHRLSGPLG